MATPGVKIIDFVISGIVQDIDWGEWEHPRQYTSQFGLLGTTVLDGLRTFRDFTCPMIIFDNFSSRSQLDAATALIEAYQGQVGAFQHVDPNGNIVRATSNVEFVRFKRGLDRYDPDLKYWMAAELTFRQLSPFVPEEAQDLVSPDSESGDE